MATRAALELVVTEEGLICSSVRPLRTERRLDGECGRIVRDQAPQQLAQLLLSTKTR